MKRYLKILIIIIVIICSYTYKLSALFFIDDFNTAKYLSSTTQAYINTNCGYIGLKSISLPNFALNKTVIASSTNTTNTPEKIVDGIYSSYWESMSPVSNVEWIKIDLGSSETFNTIIIKWHDSGEAKVFSVQVSDDDNEYVTIYSNNNYIWDQPAGHNLFVAALFSIQKKRYIKINCYQAATSKYSIEEVEVYYNLASFNNVTAFASSEENEDNLTLNAIDMDENTRWGSTQVDPQWFTVDLGTKRWIQGIGIFWEAAYAAKYNIQVSDDSENWQNILFITNGSGNFEKYIFTIPVVTRYIRFYGIERINSAYGYSFYEFFVFGLDDAVMGNYNSKLPSKDLVKWSDISFLCSIPQSCSINIAIKTRMNP